MFGMPFSPHLAGEIPPELGNIARLERVGLNRNQLTGEHLFIGYHLHVLFTYRVIPRHTHDKFNCVECCCVDSPSIWRLGRSKVDL